MTQHDKIAVIGDIHSCSAELQALLDKLPEDYFIVFAGDLFDRGPDPIGVYKIVKDLLDNGKAFYVQGNHCNKALRYFRKTAKGEKSDIKMSHGLAGTIQAVENCGMQKEFLDFLERSELKYEDDSLIVVHGAYKDHPSPKVFKAFALYGQTDRNAGLDENGYPTRLDDWKDKYEGTKTIVHGHVIYDEPSIHKTPKGATIVGIDTGCVIGWNLSAYLVPEHKVIQVKALSQYYP